jgi:hypothetical protein
MSSTSIGRSCYIACTKSKPNTRFGFVGLLERGSAPHVLGDDAFDFLADKREGLSLLSLTSAEIDLSDKLGHPVGIVLRSELHGNDADRVLATLQPS